MAQNLWTAPAGPVLAGPSAAKNTFTTAADVPVGETAGAFPQIMGGSLIPGSYIDITAWGEVSCTGTPTIIFGLYWGLVAGTALVVSTATALASGLAASEFFINWKARVVTNGSAGSLRGGGFLLLPTAVSTFATPTPFPPTTPAAISSLDMTVNTKIGLGVTWSASSASNTVTCHGLQVLVSG